MLRMPFRSNIGLLAGSLLLAAGLHGQGALLESLVSNSPFASPASAAPAAPAPASAPLEFRGVFADGGEYFFSIYDPAARTSQWASLNESGDDFTLRSYDESKQTLVADYQGRSFVLALTKAPVMATAASAQKPAPPGPQPPPQVQPTPSPPDEASRLAAIADEVRRRRELRRNAAAANVRPPNPP